MATLNRRVLGCAAVASLAALAGCGYFQPTRPRPPIDDEPLIGNYDSPAATLQTVADAIAAKGTGASVYRLAFADSTSPTTPAYHQFFAVEDEQEYKSTTHLDVPAWTLNDEITFYSSFASYRPDSYTVTWAQDPIHPDFPDQNPAELHRRYTVTAGRGAGAVVIAVGYADLQLVQGPDAQWRITIWEDRRDPEANPNLEQRTLGWRRLNSEGS